VRRVLSSGVERDGASDYGMSEAIYLRYPNGNGLELYWDRPEAKWPRDPDGRLAMFTRPSTWLNCWRVERRILNAR
jgi:catechol 2,3-dioxygenase